VQQYFEAVGDIDRKHNELAREASIEDLEQNWKQSTGLRAIQQAPNQDYSAFSLGRHQGL